MTTKEKAAKMRAMSDNELVSYVENRVKRHIVKALIRAEKRLKRR